MSRFNKQRLLLGAALIMLGAAVPCSFNVISTGTAQQPYGNPNIDMEGYLRVSKEAAKHRETRRLTEEDFIRMAAEEGTIVLDARSKEKYDLMHIKGAINLSFSDITIESLKKAIPDKDTRVLIYCNNNFQNSERAFPSKLPTASLNLSTYIALYNYGYKNIYELLPRVDPAKSKLTFDTKAK
jgi:phage shock protein E